MKTVMQAALGVILGFAACVAATGYLMNVGANAFEAKVAAMDFSPEKELVVTTHSGETYVVGSGDTCKEAGIDVWFPNEEIATVECR